MPNPVMHWQILTKQPKKLEEFYSALFGWKVSGDNALGYRQVDTAGRMELTEGSGRFPKKRGTAWCNSSFAWTM
jgi:predicted enzyme related to lactoylglutathione lyase